ncbi:MAG TPA: hypothetical protein DEP46_05820 [Blastocatellia bacterium]|nr:hypothetical protein [Blastocatellia bacterium]
MDFFDAEELEIIEYLASRDWFVTSTKRILLPSSEYKGILLKPSPFIQQAFNLHREVAVAFSPYQVFEPRAFEALDGFNKLDLRLEDICSVIISRDNDVGAKVTNILKTNSESRVIVAFSYVELYLNRRNPDFVIDRFREKFYSRDLFGIQEPLKKDLYFFGRSDLIQVLANRHLNGENSGLFGLRKTGKTSILFGVERTLDKKKSLSLYIDCETLHLKRWNTALFAISDELRSKARLKLSETHSLEEYQNTEFVSDHFLSDLSQIARKSGKKNILLIFDEIENITFGTSASIEWKSGGDFLRFWQVLRSTFQRFKGGNVFTYLIAGTNPRCVEVPTIDGVDNPIFAQFSATYIPPFTFANTREMTDRLGGYMGLVFDGTVCAKLVEDFGGHPLLMRQMASVIHNSVSGSRPFDVTSKFYDKARLRFADDEHGFVKYAGMVLEVLSNWYPEELEMLKLLAVGDIQSFRDLAADLPEFVSHLINYGIIERHDGDYFFKIDLLRTYLANRSKYAKLNPSQDERKEEIGARRNAIEPKLRNIVRRQLRARFGDDLAREKTLKVLYKPEEIAKHRTTALKELYDPNRHKIYLSSLFTLIQKNWDDCFANTFGGNVEIFKAKTALLNFYRKPDAHAAEISDADFQSFRGAMSWLEQHVDEY